jgi:ubiquinone/menaquinone biosynthesis C-methylase UbiE
MEACAWDEQLDYLIKSREFMWNADYFAFLVEKVWRLERPVNIVDFGCGWGFMCAMFMPLLPPGSTYTGIDKGKKLIEAARAQFGGKGLCATFIEADILDIQLQAHYDIAVCHTVLQHMPDALVVMEIMKNSVRQGGMVLCIEIDRNVANAGLYFGRIDYNELNTLGILQKLWVNDRKHGKGDSNIGTKLPAYMHKIGLHDIGVRVSDYVQFIDPSEERSYHDRNVQGFLDSGWKSVTREKEPKIASLIARGLSPKEARRQQEAESILLDLLDHHINDICILNTLFLIIAFGYK